MKKLKNLTAVRREEVKTRADLDNMARVAEQHGFDMRRHDAGKRQYKLDYVCVDEKGTCLQSADYRDELKIINLDEFMSYDKHLEPNLKTKMAQEYLQECIDVQKKRGQEYDKSGKGERSFGAAAQAFNAITGKDLKGSDVCLLLTMVKGVRQYSNPDRLHEDSLLDGISYLSLWAEELNKELVR